MKEVLLAKITVERVLKYDNEDYVPYYASELMPVIDEDSVLTFGNHSDMPKRYDLPIINFRNIKYFPHDKNGKYPDGLVAKIEELYVCWTPEVEQVIGIPMKEVKRQNGLIELQNRMLREQSRRIDDYFARISHANNWTFWRRLKFLFDRISI